MAWETFQGIDNSACTCTLGFGIWSTLPGKQDERRGSCSHLYRTVGLILVSLQQSLTGMPLCLSFLWTKLWWKMWVFFFYKGFNYILRFASSIKYHSCITCLKFDTYYILTANTLAIPRELFLHEYSSCISQQTLKLMLQELLNSAWLHVHLVMMPSSVNCHMGLKNSLRIHVHRQNSSIA